jgi:hypothetical protein
VNFSVIDLKDCESLDKLYYIGMPTIRFLAPVSVLPWLFLPINSQAQWSSLFLCGDNILPEAAVCLNQIFYVHLFEFFDSATV